MNNLKCQVIRLIELIEDTNMLFYQQKQKEAYQKLILIIDELITIVGMLKGDNFNKDYVIDDIKLNHILNEVMNALEAKDPVLIADILQYELIEQLKEITAMI